MKKIYKVLILLIILFLIDTILVLTNNINWFDEIVYNIVRSLSTTILDNYFKFITMGANTLVVFIILIVLNYKLSRKDAIMCDILTITGICSNILLKILFTRSRPDVIKLIEQGGYSFPSGHSMISVMLYGYLFYLVGEEVKNKKIKTTLQILLISLIISICISRIYLGVHYASDVIGGIILGLIELLLIKETVLDRRKWW